MTAIFSISIMKLNNQWIQSLMFFHNLMIPINYKMLHKIYSSYNNLFMNP